MFRKALHPEFFGIEGRKRIVHGPYEFEMWASRGGHVLMFQARGTSLCEIVTDRPESLPEKGLATAMPCAGERDHQEKFAERIEYITSIQTETLTDHLYLGTYNEMLEHGQAGDGLFVEWIDEASKPNLTVVDVQRYRDEINVQGYHLRSDCGLVLRTQSIFRVLSTDAAPVE